MPVGCVSMFEAEDQTLSLTGYLYRSDGSHMIKSSLSACVRSTEEASTLGYALSQHVLSNGGDAILRDNEKCIQLAEKIHVAHVSEEEGRPRPLTYSTVAED